MNSLKKQEGVVAIMVGICMVMFMLILAMVIDLGHLYVARTGLQNAADAAALSGARELNETAVGVTAARNEAINTAAMNTFLGSMLSGDTTWQPVDLTDENLRFSDDPYTPDADWLTYAQALAAPEGLGFIKVDTGQQGLTAFFEFWVRNISTFGRAVAGHFVTNITPIGICGLENDANDEFGFRRGVNYSFADVNQARTGLSSGTELYLHPTATSEDDCDPSGGNASFAGPFLCTGHSAISGMAGGTVYANTGLAACKTLGAINTRFDKYPACMDAELTPETCRPDVNVKQYTNTSPSVAANWMTTTQPPLDQSVIWPIAEWLAGRPQPTGATIPASISSRREGPQVTAGCGNDCSDNYGVLWSYTRPIRDSQCPNCPVTSTPAQWGSLYPSGPTASGLYASTNTCTNPDVSGVSLSPYCYGNQTHNATYYQAPTHASSNKRRLINVVIVNCDGFGGGICEALPVIGVGQFFLQTEAGGPRWINGEFVRRIGAGELDTTIRLYQ